MYSTILKVLGEHDQKITYTHMSISAGLGVIASPALGGYLYRTMGYEYPFFFIAVILFISAPFVSRCIPKEADDEV
jgi:MFS family permease